MLPPRPPLPPSGPPSGLNFSRCTDAQPLPPDPARIWMTTRSMNRGIGLPLNRPAGARLLQKPCAHRWQSVGALPGCDDVDGLAAGLDAELDRPGRRCEQRVVATAPDVDARVEFRATLADQDLAGLDDLAAEPLDAKPLG